MGYPVDLFLEENIDEEFLCAICHDVLQDVTMISACEHVFCKTCIHVWRQTKPTCPIDRQAMVKFQTPQRSFLNLLGRLRLRCPFTNLGCTSTINMGNVKEHEGKCESNPENQTIECPSGCGVSYKRRDGNSHVCPGNEAPAAATAVPWALPDGVPELLHRARNIWSGILEWNAREARGVQTKELQCSVLVALANPHIPVTGTDWPNRLVMRPFPRRFMIAPTGRPFPGVFGESDYIHFAFPQGPNLIALKTKLAECFGCIQLENPRRMCILAHSRRGETDFFVGIIPRLQTALIHHITTLIRAERERGAPEARRTPTVVLRDINRTVGAAGSIAAARVTRDSLIASRPVWANSSVRILIHRSDDPRSPRLNSPPARFRFRQWNLTDLDSPSSVNSGPPSAHASALPPPPLPNGVVTAVSSVRLAPPTPAPAPAPAIATLNPVPTHDLLRIRIRRSDIANARQALQRRDNDEERLTRVQRRIDYLERIRNDLRHAAQQQQRNAGRSREAPNPSPPTPEVATLPPMPTLSNSGSGPQEGGN